MNVTRFCAALISPAVAGILVSAWVASPRLLAQAPADAGRGRATFGLYCASCHGTSAKGDGPLASSMTTRPADLTLIAKRNGGTFPAEQVGRTIDGRSAVKGHGGGDMPVWGDAFAKSTTDGTPVEQRIQAIVHYLESIQSKP